jgi:hypothetical protein
MRSEWSACGWYECFNNICGLRECIQKFPDWPPGARTASGTPLCHYMQLYGYFVNKSSEFCRHNPLHCFSTNNTKCKRTFRYQLSRETSGYTLVHAKGQKAELGYVTEIANIRADIALGYGPDDRNFESRQVLGIFLFTTASITALGFVQSPMQWVSVALSLGVRRQEREADHWRPPSAEVKNAWIYTSNPQYACMAECSVKVQWQIYLYIYIRINK